MLLKDIREEKAALRSKCKLLRSQFTEEEKKSFDMRIFNRLTNLWRYRDCETLLTYVSSGIEVDTRALIEDALKRSKKGRGSALHSGTSRDGVLLYNLV